MEGGCVRVVAVIPARGGSKGVRNKNLRRVAGKSLIARCVDTCLASCVDDVYVSTDSNAIADIAAWHGAHIIIRPSDLAADDVLSEDVLLHALPHTRGCDVLVFAQCTAPLMTSEDINRVVRALGDHHVSIAICECHSLQVAMTEDGVLSGVGFDIDNPITRRQDRESMRIAGSVWALNPNRFATTGRLYSKDAVGVVVKPQIDIDTEADLAACDAILSRSQHAYPV